MTNYNWIAEEIRYLASKKWMTREDEEILEYLYDLRDAQQKLDKEERGQ